MIQKMKKTKGFTLIEMLVVIAIIAVLVSIIIPVVTSATEKAHEAKDAANIRSAIATVTTAGLTGDTANQSMSVTLTQTGEFDQNEGMTDIGGYDLDLFKNKTSVTIAWSDASYAVTIDGSVPNAAAACTYADTNSDSKCDTCGKTQAEHTT